MEHLVSKRHHRLQPMVMVWNTYFPNGKMVPLRQPQPPVYFGPVVPPADGQLQPQSQPPQQQQLVMNVNNEYDYHQPVATYQQKIAMETSSDQECNGSSNSQSNSNDLHIIADLSNASTSNTTNESNNCPSNSPAPTFPNATNAINAA